MIGTFIERLAAVLAAPISMTCISIAGRATGPLVGAEPAPGDFELIELGTAFVVFAFLPLAHLRGAHAVVDLATSHLPDLLRTGHAAF